MAQRLDSLCTGLSFETEAEFVQASDKSIISYSARSSLNCASDQSMSCSSSVAEHQKRSLESCSGRCIHGDEDDQKRMAKRSRTVIGSETTIIHPNEEERVIDLPLPESATDPDEYLMQLVAAMYPAVKLKVKPALELEDFFSTISEEQMARYSMQVVNLARANDVAGLTLFHAQHGRDALDCFNRFGEGLLNMACRRGFTEMVNFLLSSAVALNVRVRDDYGRTPLHDACWSPEPQLEICTWIMQKDPSLFLVADKRGYTPFQYARKSDWHTWRQFLYENSIHLKALGSSDTFRL